MRLIVAAVALLAVAAAEGRANEARQALDRARVEMLRMRCDADRQLGQSIMRLRQAGASKGQALAGMDDPQHRAMVAAAYDSPRDMSPESFGEWAELDCYRRHVGQ